MCKPAPVSVSRAQWASRPRSDENPGHGTSIFSIAFVNFVSNLGLPLTYWKNSHYIDSYFSTPLHLPTVLYILNVQPGLAHRRHTIHTHEIVNSMLLTIILINIYWASYVTGPFTRCLLVYSHTLSSHYSLTKLYTDWKCVHNFPEVALIKKKGSGVYENWDLEILCPSLFYLYFKIV